MENIIEINKLKKFYKRKVNADNGIASIFKKNIYEQIEAVKGIDIHIKKGEIVGFVGLNGSGKSTTIKTLTGILHPDEGTVKVFDLDSYKYRKKNAQNIGVMFGQKSHLLWDLPFKNSLELLKKVYSVSDDIYIQALDRADKYLDIKSLLNVPVRTMSLGQRMKCEFVAITLHNPEVYILDEPTIGLDIVTKKQIIEYLSYLNVEMESTIVLTTHDIAEVEKLCKRVIVIDQGVILIDSSMDEIVNIVTDTFATVNVIDSFICEELERVNNVKVLGYENDNIIRMKIGHSINEARKKVAEIISINGVTGISVEQPKLEDIILFLLENKEGRN